MDILYISVSEKPARFFAEKHWKSHSREMNTNEKNNNFTQIPIQQPVKTTAMATLRRSFNLFFLFIKNGIETETETDLRKTSKWNLYDISVVFGVVL